VSIVCHLGNAYHRAIIADTNQQIPLPGPVRIYQSQHILDEFGLLSTVRGIELPLPLKKRILATVSDKRAHELGIHLHHRP